MTIACVVGDLPLSAFHALTRAHQIPSDAQTTTELVRLAATEAQSGARVYREGDGFCAVDGFLLHGSGGDDARIVLRTFQRSGLDAVARLRGTFAFVLFDGASQTFAAGCDPSGGATLAYAPSRRGVLVGSRALAVARAAGAARLSTGFLVHAFLGEHSAPPGTSPVEGVRRLRPGCAIVWRNGALTHRRLVDIFDRDPRVAIVAGQAAERRLSRVLDETVCAQRARFGSAAVSLSGGIDSSLVAAAVAGSDSQAIALSVIEEGGIADIRAAAQVVRHLGMKHWHHVVIPREDAFADAGRVDGLLDDDPSVVAPALANGRQRLRAAAARLGCTAVFDGEMGDEIFDLGARAVDLASAGEWVELARYAAPRPDRRSIFLRQVLRPRLPFALRTAWAISEVSCDIWPAWVRGSFRASSDGRAIVRAAAYIARGPSRGRRLLRIVANGQTMGERVNERLRAATQGVVIVSPFGDSDVVKASLALAPSALLDSRISKPFLRRLAQSRLPREIASAPKVEAFYARREQLWLRAHYAAVVEAVAGLPELERVVDIPVLANHTESARKGAIAFDRRVGLLSAVASWASAARAYLRTSERFA